MSKLFKICIIFCWIVQKVLLGQLQGDDTFWLSFYTFPPELEFGVDGSMKHKVLLQALSMEGTDWRMVAHLLWYEPKAQILPEGEKTTKELSVQYMTGLPQGLLLFR